MSAGNEQITHLRALNLDKRTVTADGTARTGRPTDGFAIDNPMELKPAAATALTIPDGYVMGQLLLLSYQGGGTTAVTVTFTHHANGDAGTATMNADDEYLLELWTGTEWATISRAGCDDVA